MTRRDDTGASLVLALALTTFLGLVIAALLSYGAASVRATKAADTRAARTYDTDGALKTAVNQVRNSAFNGEPGEACPELAVPAADGAGLRVTCTAAARSGGGGELVPITAANRPAQGLLTLGTNPGEPGVAQQSGGTLRVQGRVFSAGPVVAGGAIESTNAQITARGPCSGTVVSRDATGAVVPNACSAPAGAIPADPNYPQPTAGLTYRPLPVCDASSTVEFLPGYYDDAVGLSALTSGSGACAGKTFHFAPAPGGGVGVYHFDFHNGEGGGLPAGARVWSINDKGARVVGGRPLGWSPDVSTPTLPGACVSPLRSTTGGGVQFVFGGDSRIVLRAGAVELCGPYSAGAPPVVLHGAKAGADVVAGPVTVGTDGTGSNPTDGPAFANPERIAAADGVPSTAVVDSTLVLGGVTASVALQGFVPPGTVPPGSILTAARLLVTHRDNNTTPTARLRLLQLTAAPARDGAPPLANVPQPTIYQDGPLGTAYHTDTLDILGSLADEVHTHGFTGLRVRYDAGVAFPNRVVEHLDSVQLQLAWKPPAVRGQGTTVNGVPSCLTRYPSGCDLLETTTSSSGLHLQGTLYAPLASVNLKLAGGAPVTVRSGAVLRSLLVQVPTSAEGPGPVIQLPGDSAGALPLDVYFRAYAGSTVLGTARVRYPAADPTATPVPGRRAVTVLSWTVRRA